MSGWKDGFEEFPWCPGAYPCGVKPGLCKICKQVVKVLDQMEGSILAEKKRHDATFDKLTEANEVKGNLLDFISSVRIWAANQPTGVSLVESCSKILEKYVAKQSVAPDPNCNHSFVKMPMLGDGFFCMNCKTRKFRI